MQSTTAVSLPSQPFKGAERLAEGAGWGLSDVTITACPQSGGSPVLECSSSPSPLPLRCAAPLSAGRFLRLGETEVDCASWAQLSLPGREVTDPEQLRR